ncbi:sugar ABC transporter substrate-binding protein [Devosia sp. Root413D1]|uniref:substrate-binding domain-containing protein n=1 Tax=unclassified Devosia TaxID=196773 RepID=UPI0006F28BC5|nr:MULTISPECIES: substrate-binding domain-containing protein [unclassified Devosia]KQU95905.1 sugar ABC transporter substrate-binding protein [Devosia sp. Root105]KQW78276.1 sugar ABC transporter substrate-binding protein [Devosia sp. Root413D1]
MKFKILTLLAGAVLISASSTAVMAAGKTIAVSWKTFQEERWKTDEAAIKKVVEAAGDTYLSTDAQGSAQKQAADIESLISQKPDVILVVAYDSDAILPSIQKISDAGIKSIAYDVQFEDPNALYITFDNVGVGRIMAEETLKVKPEGRYAFIKGDKGDPNATFLFQGMQEVLKDALASGKVTNVCETFTDGWKPDNAQKNMEQCLTSTNNGVDAVLSENDGMASGVVAALDAQGMAGSVPVTGQDGDLAAINRVALGTQLVSIWKNSIDLGTTAANAAIALADGTDPTAIPGVAKFSGGKNGVEMNAILLAPTPITKDNIQVAIDAGHITKEQACAGVTAGSVPACN